MEGDIKKESKVKRRLNPKQRRGEEERRRQINQDLETLRKAATRQHLAEPSNNI